MLSGTEAVLVAAAKNGDQAATQQLLGQEYDRIWAICRRILGNNADADDATQETLIRLVRGLPNFDERSKFSTWAYRIASNCAIDETRRRKRRQRADSIDRPRPDGRPLEVVDTHAHESIERVSDADALNTALMSIDEEFRVPLVMRDLGTLTYADIAYELDIPEGTVKSRIARGRRMLLKQISGNQPPSGNVEPTSIGP